MRGQFFHNRCLVEPVAKRFEALGAAVHREHRVKTAKVQGYVDAFVEAGNLKIVIEAEQSPARIDRDKVKAVALNAILLVIVPTSHIAQAVGRRLSPPWTSPGFDSVPIIVATLGTVLQRLAHLSRIEDALNVLQTLNPKFGRRVSSGAKSVNSK